MCIRDSRPPPRCTALSGIFARLDTNWLLRSSDGRGGDGSDRARPVSESQKVEGDWGPEQHSGFAERRFTQASI
eukprot:5634551-Alexandrium_andersonii.AAC.1